MEALGRTGASTMTVLFPRGSDNVGDELNHWLWPALLADLPCTAESTTLLGIGTLLNQDFCARLNDVSRINVLGTGAGYGPPPVLDERWHCYAVRGPRSARALGLPDEAGVADAAYLLATLDWAAGRPPRKQGRIVVVPHHRSLRLLDWAAVCEEAGLTFLSPLEPAAAFMRELTSADLVLAEAMHGAILADIARVPWVAFSFGGQFNRDKWQDWAEAFSLPLHVHNLAGFYDPHYQAAGKGRFHHLSQWLKVRLHAQGIGKRKWRSLTPPGWPLGQARQTLLEALRDLAGQAGQLTDPGIFNTRVGQLYDCVNRLRRDHGGADRQPLSGAPEAFFARQGEST